MSAFWFDLTNDLVDHHVLSVHGRRAGGRPRPRACACAAEDAAGRVRRARLHHRLGLEGLPGDRARCPASTLPEGLQESEQLPEPLYTPSTKAEVGHDEAIDFEQTVELVGDRGAGRAAARRRRSPSTSGSPTTPASAASSWPTRSSSSASTRTARSCSATRSARRTRRASGPPTATRPAARSRPSTSSTCATGRPAPAGTRPRRRRAIPDDVVARTRELYVEAYERLTGEPFAAWLERTARVRARVLIRPKAGILDPQGQTVERALPGARLRRRLQRPRRPAGRARRRGPVAAAGDVRAAARQPADRGLRDRAEA